MNKKLPELLASHGYGIYSHAKYNPEYYLLIGLHRSFLLCPAMYQFVPVTIRPKYLFPFLLPY